MICNLAMAATRATVTVRRLRVHFNEVSVGCQGMQRNAMKAGVSQRNGMSRQLCLICADIPVGNS